MTAISALELDATLEQLQQSGLVYIQKLPQPAALFCEMIQSRLTHCILLEDLSSLSRVQQQLAAQPNTDTSTGTVLCTGKQPAQPQVLLIHSDRVDLSVLQYLLEMSAANDAGSAHLRLLILETPALKLLWQTDAGVRLAQRFSVLACRTSPAVNTHMVSISVAILLLAGGALGYLVGWSDWADTRTHTTSVEPEPALVIDRAAQPVLMTADDERQVRQAIEAWRRAWEQQSWSAYKDCYVSYYLPLGDDLTHDQWVNWRRSRLERPDWIEVVISNVQLEPLDHYQVRVTFEQAYSAPGYSDTALKELFLVRLKQGWKINAERSLRTLSRQSGSDSKKGA